MSQSAFTLREAITVAAQIASESTSPFRKSDPDILVVPPQYGNGDLPDANCIIAAFPQQGLEKTVQACDVSGEDNGCENEKAAASGTASPSPLRIATLHYVHLGF